MEQHYVILQDAARGIALETISQGISVPATAAAQAKEQTHADYQFKDTGFETTVRLV